MRSTKGFLMRASAGRAGNEEEDGELEKDAELARERELARHDSGRHLERLGWAEGGLGGLLGPRAWEFARDIAVGKPKKEEFETMLCMRLGTLPPLPALTSPATHTLTASQTVTPPYALASNTSFCWQNEMRVGPVTLKLQDGPVSHATQHETPARAFAYLIVHCISTHMQCCLVSPGQKFTSDQLSTQQAKP